MRVLIIGIGDAFTRRYFGTSALIEAPDGYILLDCGDLIHRALDEATREAGWHADAMSIHDIVLTHLHGDHCNGLESFGFLRRLARLREVETARERPRLHATAPVAERVWQRLAPAMDAPLGEDRPSTLDDYYDLRVIAPEHTASIAGLSVSCRFTGHPVPTIGLLINDGRRTLGWSGDTPYDEAHIQWLSAADVIVHECNLSGAHTAIEQLDALPEDFRRRTRLIHLPDDFDASVTDMKPLRQGEVLQM